MKVGRIQISDAIIRDFANTERSDLYDVFAQFIPVKIDHNPLTHSSIYWGYSDKFDDIPEGIEIPLYDCIITINNNGHIIEFVRL